MKGVYIINLEKYESIGINCIALYVNNDNVIHFDSFWYEHFSKEIKKIIGFNKCLQNTIIQLNNVSILLNGID